MAQQQAANPKEFRQYLASQYGLVPEQIDVVRNAICIGATDAELEFFLATCKRVQLDPFARQIWFVKRRQKRIDARGNEEWVDVGRPETGIDGYRTIAERSGQYRGQDPIQWCDESGRWGEVWLSKDHPAAARASVYREGFVKPLVAVAHFSEYAAISPKTNQLVGMWKKMGANQLSKCAEALALRRAWPQNLSGLQTAEEMEHVDAEASSYVAPAATTGAKQIEQRKPDRATEIVTKAPDTAKQAEPATRSITKEEGEALANAARAMDPATTKTAAREALQKFGATSDEIDSMREMSDLDKEIAVMLETIDGAQVQSDIASIGRVLQTSRKAEEPTDRDRELIDRVWRPFADAWRRLPAKGGGR